MGWVYGNPHGSVVPRHLAWKAHKMGNLWREHELPSATEQGPYVAECEIAKEMHPSPMEAIGSRGVVESCGHVGGNYLQRAVYAANKGLCFRPSRREKSTLRNEGIYIPFAHMQYLNMRIVPHIFLMREDEISPLHLSVSFRVTEKE